MIYQIIALSLMTMQAYAQDSVSMAGAASFTDQTFKGPLTITGSLSAKRIEAQDIIVTGAAELSRSKIFGKTTIMGTLDSSENTFYESVTISGALLDKKSSFQKTVLISGGLDAVGSTFSQTVTGAGQSIEFELSQCSAKDIVIETEEQTGLLSWVSWLFTKKKKKIVLKAQTTVGSIQFFDIKNSKRVPATDGIVELSDDSKIEGTVTGGKVISIKN
jgi:hypothetical protein